MEESRFKRLAQHATDFVISDRGTLISLDAFVNQIHVNNEKES